MTRLLLAACRTYVVLFRLAPAIVTVLLLTGCPQPDDPVGPPVPSLSPVSPGTTCSPAGSNGVLLDGRPAVCDGDGRWRAI